MKLVVILLAIIALGGTVVGLGAAGVINIPGITPPKNKKRQTLDIPKPTEKITQVNAQTATVPPPISPDPAKVKTPKDGTDRVAKLWSNMDADTLLKVLKKWPEGDAVTILAKMDDAKLTQLLVAMAAESPDKAAEFSKLIKALPKGGK